MVRVLFLAALFAGVGQALSGSTALGLSTDASITGHVYYTNTSGGFGGGIVLVPASVSQPIAIDELADNYFISFNNRSGEFSAPGLSAGDYLLGLFRMVNRDAAPTLQDDILIAEGASREVIPATHLTLEKGQSLTIDIPITIPPEWLTPEPTPTCLASQTASVSGHVTSSGYHSGPVRIGWIPGDGEQPANAYTYLDNSVQADTSGDFTIRCLQPGEYLVFVLDRDASVVDSGLEEVRFYAGNDRFSFYARRVRVGDSQAVTGIDFSVMFPTPEVVVDFLPTPTPLPGVPEVGSADRYITDTALATIAGLLAGSAITAVALVALSRRRLQRRR